MSYNLDISSLRKAIASLERSLRVLKAAPEEDEELYQTLQAGVVQAFEFSYELCWKFMKRWLELNISPQAADGVPRRELFRLSAQNQLITDVEQWMLFHRARNQTSHIYDTDIADEVYQVSKSFLPCAKDFFNRLEQRL